MNTHPRFHACTRALLLAPLLFTAACSDSSARASDAGPLFSTTCGTAHHVTFRYYNDASLLSSGTSNLYTGELRWVDIDVRDASSCRLPASRISAVTVSAPTLLGLQVANSLNPVYRLQALKYDINGAQLRVTVDGTTFTSNISLFNPTVRIFTRAGTEITGTLPVEVDIWTEVMAKAYAGSSLSSPVIATAGFPAQPLWSSGNSARAIVSSSSTAADAALSAIRGVAVGSTTLNVQMVGITKSVSVDVRAKAATANVTVAGPASLTEGQTGSYTATPRDASGNILSGRTVTWAVDNTAIATITQAGLVTTVGPGSTTVRATVDGTQGTAPLQVNATPGINLSVTYPNGTPTLSWTTTFSGAHDVLILREEEIADAEFGNSYNEYWEYVGTTSATSFQDTSNEFTDAGICVEGDIYSTRTVKTFYVVMPAGGVESNRVWAKIVPIGEPCWVP